MPNYDPTDLRTLLVRCKEYLGNETLKRIADSPPRRSSFSTALSASIKHNDGDPSKVTDSQIKGALEIALEVWPYEAERIANAVYGGDAS